MPKQSRQTNPQQKRSRRLKSLLLISGRKDESADEEAAAKSA